MIGGQGEKKTLRLMAEHAEMANFTAGFDELPRKLEVLAGHCADVGRDPATINKTPLCSVVVGDTMEEAVALRNAFLLARGLDFRHPRRGHAGRRGRPGWSWATPMRREQVRDLMALGLDGITANLPANGHDPEAVARTVKPGRRRRGSARCPVSLDGLGAATRAAPVRFSRDRQSPGPKARAR